MSLRKIVLRTVKENPGAAAGMFNGLFEKNSEYWIYLESLIAEGYIERDSMKFYRDHPNEAPYMADTASGKLTEKGEEELLKGEEE